jgi:DNA polymerase III delta subunit
MIALKGMNFWNIVNELEKIYITKDFIDIWDLQLVSKDIEENIFDIINDILNGEIKKALPKLRELSDFLDNPYYLYNSLASNLRLYFYIFKLKLLSVSNTQIKEMWDLWNRAFLVDKNYKIDKIKFIQIYEKIASIDAKMKTGNLLWSENSDMLYEIEKSLII